MRKARHGAPGFSPKIAKSETLRGDYPPTAPKLPKQSETFFQTKHVVAVSNVENPPPTRRTWVGGDHHWDGQHKMRGLNMT